MKTFVVVDNLPSHRQGCRELIENIDGAMVVDALDFPEALARPSWDDIDFVVCDMADEPLSQAIAQRTGREDEQRARHLITDYVSIDLIDKIKTVSPMTQVIAVTGHSFAFENPVIRRIVIEAEADHFVHRGDLDAVIVQLGESGGDIAEAMEALGPPPPQDEIASLGVTRRTRLLEAIRTMAKDRYRTLLESTKVPHVNDRVSRDLKKEVEGAAKELRGVDPKGNATARAPRIVQLRRIWTLASRIPEVFRNRGN